MSEVIRTLSDLEEGVIQNSEYGKVNYKDDDILILDSIRPLSTPDSIYVKMNIVCACKKGKIEATTKEGIVQIEENSLFICSPDTVVENIMVSPDLECAIVCITSNGLRSILGNYMQLWTKTIVVNKLNVMKLDAMDMQFYNHIYSLLEMSINGKYNEHFKAWFPFRRDIVQQTLKFGLLGLCNGLAVAAQDTLPAKANSDNGFARFMDLLQNTNVKYQKVDYYADKLCITSKYLTVLCKKYSNKTAQEWICEYTLNDISYYLRNTNLTLKEITDRLGFPNTSFFGKYVKFHFGLTPRQYRDQATIQP